MDYYKSVSGDEKDNRTLIERLSSIEEKLNSEQRERTSKMRIPKGAKVSKGMLKKGYIGILRVDENGNISGEKQKLSGSAFRTKDGLYHATDGREIVMWEGKHPIVVQPTWRINPINLRKKDGEENETYGQEYTMAKMLKDVIVKKSLGGAGWIIWIIVAGIALFGINYLTGGKIFG